WTRERSLRIAGEPVLFHERFFLARVGHAAVNLANLLPYEREIYRDHRWWPLDELRDTSENVIPEGLAYLLAPVLDGYTPATPLTIQ
ncbi:MAG TPA: hypothetical protein VGR88_01650, partial [Ktedonobacterales bacterium]|nr:hypothetical protein [Ktedonobacterales bacterium]